MSLRLTKTRTSLYRRLGGLALLAAAAVALAGCGGSKGPSVASVGTTTSNSSARSTNTSRGGSGETASSGSPTQLLDEWAGCMRKHGDPNQADPSIDAHKVIHISINGAAIPGGFNGTNKGGQGNLGPGQYCRTYLQQAQNGLRGGRQLLPDRAKVLKYSECMRANGIPDFPDPTANGLQMNMGGDLNPHSPAFQYASRICAEKIGVPGLRGGTQPGMIVLNGAGPP